jgi:hypothetical protein
MYGAGAALANTATKFGAQKGKMVAQHPKKWCIGINFYLFLFSVDSE